MSTQRESSFTDDKTVMKGGGQDVAVGNPGMMWDTDTPTNPNLATPNRGSEIHSVTAGSDELFTARSETQTDDYDIMNFQIASPGTTDLVLFIADREIELKSVTARIVTKGGSAHTAQVFKADSGTAIAGGTSMTSTIAIGSTASQDTNISGTLSTTEANLKVSSGQAIGLDLAGTAGSAAGLTITMVFRRVAEPARRNTSIE